MDLTRHPPRSPCEELGGCVMLGRTIDKARAHLAGSLGDYHYNCPLDIRLFDFLGISHKGLAEAARDGATDGEVLAWVQAHSRPHEKEEIDRFNAEMKAQGPVTDEQRSYFLEARQRVGRTDVRTWFDLIEAEEGRLG